MGKIFDPNAILYRWLFREEDGHVRLIGTDPALADRTRFFRWPSMPGGWEQREPWTNGIASAELVDNAVGGPSGWPGATPLRGKVGRPPKEPAKKDLPDGDKPTGVKAFVKRTELFEIQRLASDAQKSVSEWAATVIREALARSQGAQVEPVEPVAEPAGSVEPKEAAPPSSTVSDGDKPAGVKTFVRRSELFQMQRLASDMCKTVSEWAAIIIRDALARARKS